VRRLAERYTLLLIYLVDKVCNFPEEYSRLNANKNLNRFLFIVFLLVPSISNGQYITPDSKVLRTNKVKKLTVLNCLDSSFCYMDEYEYNKNGLIIKELPGVVAVYLTWDYYDDGKLKTYYSKTHSLDSIFAADHYYYYKDGKFKYIISEHFEDSRIISTDTIYKLPETKKSEGKRNSKKQIIEQDLGDLHFPCGIEFNGKHKIQYEYLSNGLLLSARIFNSSGKLIINFSFSYDYF